MINYTEFGKGKKTMVILPGLSLKPVTGDGAAIAQAYDLFSKEYTVYLFDVRQDTPEDYTIEDMADDAVEAFSVLQLHDIYLFGVSQGGMIAQMIALKYPQYLKKVIFCSTVSEVRNRSVFDEWQQFAFSKDIKGLVDSFCRKVYSKGFYDQYIDIIQQAFADTSDAQLVNYINCCKAIERFSVTDRLKEIAVPSMVIGAKTDRVFAYEDMKALADQLKTYSYFYEEGPHAFYDEKADAKERLYAFFEDQKG